MGFSYEENERMDKYYEENRVYNMKKNYPILKEKIKQLEKEHEEMLKALIEVNKIYKYLIKRYEKEEFDPTIHNAIPKHSKYIQGIIEKIKNKSWEEI